MDERAPEAVIGPLGRVDSSGQAARSVRQARRAGVGVAGGLALSLIVADVQANAADAVRGRVVSTYTVISHVVPTASGVAAGALVQRFGVSAALYACGATLVAAMLLNALWMTALGRYRG